jgi:hypothetical protein
MSKIKIFKNDFKISLRYCQITKFYFKYYKSLYSSTVWLDKPLIRLPIFNIEKLIIGKNTIQNLKQSYNIKVIIQIHIRFDESNIIYLF